MSYNNSEITVGELQSLMIRNHINLWHTTTLIMLINGYVFVDNDGIYLVINNICIESDTIMINGVKSKLKSFLDDYKKMKMHVQ